MIEGLLFDIDKFLDSSETRQDSEQIGHGNARRGRVAELVFEIQAALREWDACKCLSHIAPYDYVIRLDGKWRTVQVKIVGEKSYLNRGRPYCVRGIRLWRGQRKTTHGGNPRRYRDGDFDLLFATTGSDEHWLIPYKRLSSKWFVAIDHPGLQRYKIANRDIGL